MSESTKNVAGNSGCSLVKVTVNVDLSGEVRTAICPDNEIIIGFLPLPAAASSWADIDAQLFTLFDVRFFCRFLTCD